MDSLRNMIKNTSTYLNNVEPNNLSINNISTINNNQNEILENSNEYNTINNENNNNNNNIDNINDENNENNSIMNKHQSRSQSPYNNQNPILKSKFNNNNNLQFSNNYHPIYRSQDFTNSNQIARNGYYITRNNINHILRNKEIVKEYEFRLREEKLRKENEALKLLLNHRYQTNAYGLVRSRLFDYESKQKKRRKKINYKPLYNPYRWAYINFPYQNDDDIVIMDDGTLKYYQSLAEKSLSLPKVEPPLPPNTAKLKKSKSKHILYPIEVNENEEEEENLKNNNLNNNLKNVNYNNGYNEEYEDIDEIPPSTGKMYPSPSHSLLHKNHPESQTVKLDPIKKYLYENKYNYNNYSNSIKNDNNLISPGNNLFLHKDYGRIPAYLLRRKEELKSYKEDKIRREKERRLPKGTRFLDENERKSRMIELSNLKRDLEDELFKLPIARLSYKQIERKGEIEKALDTIDEEMNRLSYKDVIVKI
jgi:hypothetical protein